MVSLSEDDLQMVDIHGYSASMFVYKGSLQEAPGNWLDFWNKVGEFTVIW